MLSNICLNFVVRLAFQSVVHLVLKHLYHDRKSNTDELVISTVDGGGITLTVPVELDGQHVGVGRVPDNTPRELATQSVVS